MVDVILVIRGRLDGVALRWAVTIRPYGGRGLPLHGGLARKLQLGIGTELVHLVGLQLQQHHGQLRRGQGRGLEVQPGGRAVVGFSEVIVGRVHKDVQVPLRDLPVAVEVGHVGRGRRVVHRRVPAALPFLLHRGGGEAAEEEGFHNADIPLLHCAVAVQVAAKETDGVGEEEAQVGAVIVVGVRLVQLDLRVEPTHVTGLLDGQGEGPVLNEFIEL